MGELPVNLIFVGDGEEELGSQNPPWSMQRYGERLKKADALISPSASPHKEEEVVNICLGGPGNHEVGVRMQR